MFRTEIIPYKLNVNRLQIEAKSKQKLGCPFIFKSKSFLAFKSNGRYLAILNNCPHQNKPLDFAKCYNNTITCPFHGYSFNLDNAKSNGMALEVYEMEVKGEDVFIRYPKLKWF